MRVALLVRRVFTIFFVVTGISFAHAADITLSPSSGSYKVGSTITVSVMLSGNRDTINAVGATIGFSSDTLELQSISKSSSILSLWAEDPSFSNSNAKASFEGGVTSPGFSQASGRLVTLTFKVKEVGRATVTVISGSVLANDGNGTNVLREVGSANYTIDGQASESTPTQAPVYVPAKEAPSIQSSSYPDSSKWYSSRDAVFSWKLPSGVTAVRTLYDEKPTSNPTRVYAPAIKEKTFEVDGDGVMYMHVQFKDDSGWGEVSHRKFQIDTVPPTAVHVKPYEDENGMLVSSSIVVESTDELSGLDAVSLEIDGGAPVRYPIAISNIYRLPNLAAGKHSILVSVFDKAGNQAKATFEIVTKESTVPVITEYTKRLTQGENVVIHGTAQPGASVEILFTSENHEEYVGKATADANGAFTFTRTDEVATGIYEIKARALFEDALPSAYSDSKLMVVESIKLIRIGMFIMNWLSLALILILASALIIGTLWYSFLQFTRFRRKIHRTMRDAENTLKANVQALRRDTEEFHTMLTKAEKKRELTKEESAILKKFKKRLDITEKEIEEKLEQIG